MVQETLKNLAAMHGGACVYEFAQGEAFKVAAAQQRHSVQHTKGTWNDQGKMYKMVLRGDPFDQSEMGGVCATICAFWIAFHANQGQKGGSSFTNDRAFWDYLFNGGGLNMGAAMNIVVEHHQSTGNQLQHIANVLSHFKVIRRTKRTGGGNIAHGFVPFNPSTTFSCAREITANYGYKLIQLKKELDGSGSGHMVCAWCEGQDVLFMDPNLGEYWFPHQKAFNVRLTYFWTNTYGRNNNYKAMRVHDWVYNG